jgi:glycosyltransferase involved in cell wall biosynthesis
MKYLFLTDGASYFPQLMVDFERAGLYNWYKCMDGEVRLWSDLKHRKHELLDYDIIHINLASSDIGLAAKVKPLLEGSSTTLVVNMDYSINYMDNATNLREFIADLQACDCAFGVEPSQVNLIHYIISVVKDEKSETRMSLMPHPVDLATMESKIWVDYDRRLNMLAYQFHKYDSHWQIPRLLMLKLPVLTTCLGYSLESFKTQDMADLVMPYIEWEKYIRFLAYAKYGFEYRTHKAASRFVMEAGSLGIPVVTTHDSFMGHLIYPDVCHPVEDFFSIRKSLEKLIEDEEWRLTQAREGLERLEAYNFENSKKSMEALVGETTKS